MSVNESPLLSVAHERQENIQKFHRFVHNLPFLNDATKVYDPLQMSVDTIDQSTEDITKKMRAGESVVVSSVLVAQLELDSSFSNTRFSRIAARSGQNSRHGVFFGNLALGPTSINVAVKVFPDIEGTLDPAVAQEVVKSHAVINKSMRTFEPLAIGRFAGTAYSLWTLERNTSTLDSIDWTKFAGNPGEHPGMAGILRKTAAATADIHSQGWGHGDLHPRNLAVDVTGGVYPIDWETAKLGGATDDPETRFSRANGDLMTLTTAFYHPVEHAFNPGIGIFSETDTEKSHEIFEEHFMKHYVKRRIERSDGGSLDDLSQILIEMHDLPNMIGYNR